MRHRRHSKIIILIITFVMILGACSPQNAGITGKTPENPTKSTGTLPPENKKKSSNNYQYDKVVGQSLPTTEKSLKFFRLPYYFNSSTGGVLLSRDGSRLFQFDDTGIAYRDQTAGAKWNVIMDFGQYQGIGQDGILSMSQDPVNSDVIYACGGESYASDNIIDNQVGQDLANLFVSYDKGNTFRMLNDSSASFVEGYNGYDTVMGNGRYNGDQINAMILRMALGCAGSGHSRFIYEQATGIEMWIMHAVNDDAVAYDSREHVTVDGVEQSRTVFVNTYLQGLFKGVIDENGFYTWTNIFGKPVSYDDFIDGGKGSPMYDPARYQYAPQQNDWTAEQIASYRPESNLSQYDPVAGSCSFVTADGRRITGTPYNGKCLESSENHKVGTSVVIDETTTADTDNPSPLALMYAGYMTNDLFKNGGFFAIYLDENSNVLTSRELMHPVTGVHLDVRDIVVDPTHKVNIVMTVRGQTYRLSASKYFYVAAGRNGIFRGTVLSNGGIVLQDLNTDLYTRDDFLIDRARNQYNYSYCGPGSQDRCGQFITINRAEVDGVNYLLAIELTGIYLAIEDYTNPPHWQRLGPLSLFGSTRVGGLNPSEEEGFETNGNFGSTVMGGVIDTEAGEIILPLGELIYKVPFDSLRPCINDQNVTYDCLAGDFEAFHEGFGDRTGNPIFDIADPDHTMHMSRLDGGYIYSSWSDEFASADVHTNLDTEAGFCAGSYLVTDQDYQNLSVDADQKLTASLVRAPYSYTLLRQSQYGNKISSSSSSDKKVMYVSGADDSGRNDGFIYRAQYDDESDKWHWAPAMGDGECRAVYPYENHSLSVCVQLCNSDSGAHPLPLGAVLGHAVSNQNPDKVWVIVYNKNNSQNELYLTEDGGQNWTRQNFYRDDAGQSLSTLGMPTQMTVQDNDDNGILLAYPSRDVYYYHPEKGSFINVTQFSSSTGSKTLLGKGANGRLPYITDMKTMTEGQKSYVYLSVAVSCGGASGVYPISECQEAMGGGVYRAEISGHEVSQFVKLNADSPDVEFFNASSLAVSPANPQYIVAVGSGLAFDWSGGGNVAELTSGAMYTKDGGKTWKLVTDVAFNALKVSAHPEKANIFLVSTTGAGIWWLDLEAP